MVLEAW